MGKFKLKFKLGKEATKILELVAGGVQFASKLAPAPADAILRAISAVIKELAESVDEDSEGGAKITPDEALAIGEALIDALKAEGAVE